MKKLLILLAVCTWGYAAAQNNPNMGTTGNTGARSADTSVTNFVIQAAMIDMMEIRTGQLAQQKAGNAGVKAYADMMVKDHTNSSNELKTIASKKNIQLPMMDNAMAANQNRQGTMGTGQNQTGTTNQNGTAGGNTGTGTLNPGNTGGTTGTGTQSGTAGRNTTGTGTVTQGTTGTNKTATKSGTTGRTTTGTGTGNKGTTSRTNGTATKSGATGRTTTGTSTVNKGTTSRTNGTGSGTTDRNTTGTVNQGTTNRTNGTAQNGTTGQNTTGTGTVNTGRTDGTTARNGNVNPTDRRADSLRNNAGTSGTGNMGTTGRNVDTGDTMNRMNMDQGTMDHSRMHEEHQQKLRSLEQKFGDEFDREYINMMVNDHAKAISLYERATGSTDADIREFATKTLPVLRKHQDSAKSLMNTIKATSSPEM